MKLDLAGARIGIVLGSGLERLTGILSEAKAIPYARIRGFPETTVVGHRGELVLGKCSGVRVAVLSGRVHFYEGHPMSRVVAAVRELARAGARAVVLTNAAGAIRKSFRPGDLMLISDHVNGFGTNPLIGENDDSIGPRFPDLSEVYDAEFRKLARAAARRLRIRLREGIYVGLPGPGYETPAEIRMWRRLGADAVGMSTVPEAIALRHAGVRVLAVSTVTNMGAGILPIAPAHRDVLERGRQSAGALVRLLTALVGPIERSLA